MALWGLLFIFSLLAQISSSHGFPPDTHQWPLSEPIIAPKTIPLVNFQVYEPVLTPLPNKDKYGCVYTELLMDHIFAFSYGRPFVGSYTPPPCDFNKVTMNLTVTSRGRQFDRLGMMYLGDIEVFRTSTSEPTKDGIVWTYIKEMDQYNVLWKTEQKIIFDLGNLVSDIYTGAFNATLTATFFTVPEPRASADLILPISAKKSAESAGSAFSLPDQIASVNHQLPRNIKRAVVSISACGQSTEEFWYTNALTSDADTFAGTTGSLYGRSPFREVQLLIDGQIAGVSWPFPIIFTGGISPGLWRPIAGIDAFDLREREIDITPWLPLLCDGASHTFEIRVVGLDDNGAGHATLSQTVGSYWVVTGKIFLFLDRFGSVTKGPPPTVKAPPARVRISSKITTNFIDANETLIYKTRVARDFSVLSTIITSHGSFLVNWTQHLSYSSSVTFLDQGLTQLTHQRTVGSDASSSGYINTYSYPLTVNSSYVTDAAGNFGISASVSRSLDYNVFGASIFPSGIRNFQISGPTTVIIPGSPTRKTIQLSTNLTALSGALLSTTQSGSAGFMSAGTRSYSYGTTEQDFSFKGVEASSGESSYEIYKRHVLAVNFTVTEDLQKLVRQTLRISAAQPGEILSSEASQGFSIKCMLGRGPGKTKAELAGGGIGGGGDGGTPLYFQAP